MIGNRRVGFFGGTFDPVHTGHVAAAFGARAALRLGELHIVPAHDPRHRAAQPGASGYHRFAMAALAFADDPDVVMSDIELASDEPSYTATTLRRLHTLGFRPVELFFIVGSDAFAEIATWRDYPAVVDLSHFVVISRPTLGLDALRLRVPDLAPRMHLLDGDLGAGTLDEWERVPSIFLVPRATPDVSSTEIRERARAALPLAGLVPPAVDRYILRHGLYLASRPDRRAR